MPCHAAMTDKFITITEDEIVEKTLKTMAKAKTSCAAVIDDQGALSGMFSIKSLLKNTQPINVPMSGTSIAGSVNIDSGPGIAKRIQKVKPLAVRDFMERKFNVVYPETPTWEGVKRLLEQDTPLIVIDKDSQKPLGLITEESLLEEFERMQD